MSKIIFTQLNCIFLIIGFLNSVCEILKMFLFETTQYCLTLNYPQLYKTHLLFLKKIKCFNLKKYIEKRQAIQNMMKLF